MGFCQRKNRTNLHRRRDVLLSALRRAPALAFNMLDRHQNRGAPTTQQIFGGTGIFPANVG
jgi:hypothetical protein